MQQDLLSDPRPEIARDQVTHNDIAPLELAGSGRDDLVQLQMVWSAFFDIQSDDHLRDEGIVFLHQHG